MFESTPNPWTPIVAHLIVLLMRVAVCFSSRFFGGCFLSHCFCQFLQRYRLRMRTFLDFSHSVLLLEAKQSCLEENGRGLLYILIGSNPSPFPRAIQSFCTGNRVSTCICSSHAGGPKVGLCSPTLRTGQYVILAHLSLFCVSQFGPTSGNLPFWHGFLA